MKQLPHSSTPEVVWSHQARSLLAPLYTEASRAYHGMNHVQALLNLLDAHKHLIKDPVAVTLAIWFHDAIYDSSRHDNEEQSAVLAEQTLPGWGCSAALTASVAGKVRATQGHTWTDGDPDTAVFLDFDLGILAAPEAAYQRYAEQVAQEYAWVPTEAYRLGRAKVLRSFLERSVLYFTPALREKWESAARANLARELAQLSIP
ncbi:N-methyl-D-aspartate receptor NMDAR2C subunit [Aquabacterium sp.]|uniref:HD domain-containing protein n=1 Tax=Aquabacterium sp. TaxID=1872578 RepID=UPI0024884FF0|nr:N-methyl-D-aspartate receptor NMDAR2C subunit [Aquabacterium sp.]MDI1260548.1 N-methyl-D-aspartate receptor NMDAR2C subunit [Aquabacterium sp.]